MTATTLTLRTDADLENYLVHDAVIDHRHPLIRDAVTALRNSSGTVPDSDIDVARVTFEFVRDEVRHSADIGHWPATYVASDVLRERNGICHAKSHLLAALLRAQGIPAGLCYQRLTADVPGGFVLHGLNALYLASADRWVRVDARGNRPGIDAQFALDAERCRLAWPVDPALGEVDYPTVRSSPPPTVLEAMAAAVPGTAGYGNLPTRL